jgi:hypothetical protein
MDQNIIAFLYVKHRFPSASKVQVEFEGAAWREFKVVDTNLLENLKAEYYKLFIELVNANKVKECKMS